MGAAKKRGFAILCFVFVWWTMNAQTVIEGIVRDKEDKKAIGGVIVTILDDNGETLAYDASQKDGAFSVSVSSPLPSLTLQARLLGLSFIIHNS